MARAGTGSRSEMMMMDPFSQLDGVRRCPWCGSTKTRLVPRGLTGITDEFHQFFTCHQCGKVTFELVAKTAREMRLERYHVGDAYVDEAQDTAYTIIRVLRVGVNEYLIYLRPDPMAVAKGEPAEMP